MLAKPAQADAQLRLGGNALGRAAAATPSGSPVGTGACAARRSRRHAADCGARTTLACSLYRCGPLWIRRSGDDRNGGSLLSQKLLGLVTNGHGFRAVRTIRIEPQICI